MKIERKFSICFIVLIALFSSLSTHAQVIQVYKTIRNSDNSQTTTLVKTYSNTSTDKYKAVLMKAENTIISISITGDETIKSGSSAMLTATVSPSNTQVIWSSSDSNIAIVNATTGVVSALNVGTVTIIATAKASDGSVMTATYTIKVQ